MLALAGILVLYLGFETYEITIQDFDVDEFITSTVIRMPLPDLIKNLTANGHPPLYFIMAKGWTWLAGHSATSILAFSILIGALSVLAMYLLALELGLGRWGLMAALLWALHPSVVYFARYGRPYMGVTLFVILAIWATLAALRRKDEVGYLLLFLIGAFGAAWNHMLVLIWISLAIGVVLLDVPRRNSRLGFWAAIIAVLMVHGAIMGRVFSVTGAQPIGWIEKPTLFQAGSLFLKILGGKRLWLGDVDIFWVPPLVALAGVIVGTCMAFFRSDRFGPVAPGRAPGGPEGAASDPSLAACWQLVALATLFPIWIMVWTTYAIQPMLVFRYLNIFVPGFVLFTVWVLARLPWRPISIVLVLLVVGITINMGRDVARDRHKRGLRELIGELDERYRHGEGEVVLTFNHSAIEGMELFAKKNKDFNVFKIYRRTDHDVGWQEFRAGTDGYDRLWVLGYRYRGSIYDSPQWKERAGKKFFHEGRHLAFLEAYELPEFPPPDTDAESEEFVE